MHITDDDVLFHFLLILEGVQQLYQPLKNMY